MSAPDQPVLSIIIPSYNRQSYLEQTLRHLYDALPDGVEVLVIDDASTDETTKMLEERFPQVRLFSSPTRQGPAISRNIGLEKAGGRYFLPLDSDCFIVPETLQWLVRYLTDERPGHLLLSCRSWPQRSRSVHHTPGRLYTEKDLFLKAYGEVVPVLRLEALQRHSLRYPPLFAGGEPLLLVDLCRLEPLTFIDKVVLEYRTDCPNRISTGEYQLQYPLEIARVFEAYLPYLHHQTDPQLRGEYARMLERAGVYLLLAGNTRQGLSRLLQSARAGRPRTLLFCAASLLPAAWLRSLFAQYRRRREAT